MNYLAHLYLSGENNEIKVGNFIADAVKGRSYMKYAQGIQDGIILHRKIDQFTDTHLVFIQSKKKLNNHYSLFSGVVIDIFYDHFLSKFWNEFSSIPFDKFTKEAYNLMFSNFAILPNQVKYFLPFMAKNNWLKIYGDIKGIERVLKGLSKRTSLPDKTSFAIDILQSEYEALKEEFFMFFSDIKLYIEENEGINLKIHE
jgi:acyl carrier protein phosphodiesterase